MDSIAKPDHFYVGTKSSLEKSTLTTSVFLSNTPDIPIEDAAEIELSPAKPLDLIDDLEKVQRAFFTQMHAFMDVLPAGANLVPALRGAWLTLFEKEALEKRATARTQDGDWRIWEIPDFFRGEINRTLNKSRRMSDAFLIFPQLMLLGIVSQFDAYMGSVLRLAISKRPDIIQRSQKSFPASEVLQYSDIDAFKEAVIEKEIEGFLRKSHEEQFAWLSATFEVKTTDGLRSWPEFVEACERRNLFAHSNGIVSEQYKIKCMAVGASCPYAKGERLDVSSDYIRLKLGIFLEIGVKIAQVISRKLDRSVENAIAMDKVLNDISYELISHEHYREASDLLDFGVTTIKQHPDAEVLNMMIVNNANAHKLAGDAQQAAVILAQVDWSPFDAKYKISVAAVLDDIERVIELMPQIMYRADFPESSYQDWPVFYSIRSNSGFLEAFQKCYGKPFTVRSDKVDDGMSDTSLDEAVESDRVRPN